MARCRLARGDDRRADDAGPLTRLHAPLHRIEIAVDAAQQVDQDFPLRPSSGRTAIVARVPAQRRSRCRGSRVPSRSAKSNGCVRRQAPVRIVTRPRFCIIDSVRLTGPLSNPMTWQMREAGMPGSIAKQRHDPPFRDVDAEMALIERGRAVRQLVGDEGDEGRNVAVEIERSGRFHLATAGRTALAGSVLPRMIFPPGLAQR